MTVAQETQRKNALGARLAMTDEQRSIASEKICASVVATEYFEVATSVAVYVPMPGEVDTWPLIECAIARKLRIFAPVMQPDQSLRFREFRSKEDLASARWGILEPVSGAFCNTAELDLVILPVAAFDADRNRIGMGGGFYDRTFSFTTTSDSASPRLIGVAFDCQRVEKIAPNPWDIRLLRIYTESACY